jgi:hypothetical protein
VTEQEEAAKNWEMLQAGKALAAKVARLQDELRQFSLDWTLLGRESAEGKYSYRLNGENIDILRVDVYRTKDATDPQFSVQSSVRAKHFDLAVITTLLTELSDAKRDLALAREQLRKLGVDHL